MMMMPMPPEQQQPGVMSSVTYSMSPPLYGVQAQPMGAGKASGQSKASVDASSRSEDDDGGMSLSMRREKRMVGHKPTEHTLSLQEITAYIRARREELDSQEITSFIKDHPDIGLATMSRGIFTHKQSKDRHTPLFDRCGWIVILCMQATILAQLLIPGSIFVSSIGDYLEALQQTQDGGSWFCPNVKSERPQERIIMLMIALIYVARLTLLAIKKGNDLLGDSKGKRRPYVNTQSGRNLFLHTDLQAFMLFDQWMDVVYEPAVYCINLFLVFITDSSIDMVLNALAMEFVMKLDEDLKSYLFELLEEEDEEEDFCLLFYQTAAEHKRVGENAIVGPSSTAMSFKSVFIVAWLVFSVMFALFFVVYGPLCKPDVELGLMR